MELYQMIIEHVTGGKFKGKVASTSALPASATFRDIYNVGTNDYIQGDDYIWSGKEWVKLTSALDLSMYDTRAHVSSTYAPKASPALTGNPTAPTASAGTSSTQIATTAFVTAALGAFVTKYGLTEVTS